MFTLIYRSRLAIGTDMSEISGMLDRARVQNHIDGITGYLLYHGERFLQLIEGKEDDVRELYSKIENDPRHTDVELLCTEKVQGRMFGKWPMLFSDSANTALGSGEKLRLFNGVFHGNEVAMVPGRFKFILWEQVHQVLSTQCAYVEIPNSGDKDGASLL